MIKQSSTYTFTFLMVLSSDHVSPATGKTVVVNLSKAGGAFGAAGGTVTEIANGWYKCAFTATDTNTLGDISINCTVATCDPTDAREQIVAVDFLDAVAFGLSRVDATITSRLATGAVTVGTNNDKTGYALTAGEHTNIVSDVNTSLDAAGTELAAIPNPSNATLRQKIQAIYQYFFHKRITTATLETTYKADSATSLGTSTVSNDGTTATHSKIA